MVNESDLGDKDSTEQEVLYYLKDMLGSVVALTDSNGLVVERYEYDPYGRTEVLTVTYMHDANLDGKIDASDEAHLNACLATEEMQRHPMCVFVHDTDGDGIVDLDDLSVFEGFDYSSNGPRPPAEWERAPTSLYDANNDKHVEMFDFYGFQVCFASTNSLCHYVFDANDDSQVTLADYTTFLASYQRTAPARTATNGASRFGNPFMWTGQRFDAAVGLYHFYFRSYSPELGRWLQRDPLGYVDSATLYEYVMSQPLVWKDRFGLSGYSWEDEIDDAIRRRKQPNHKEDRRKCGLGLTDEEKRRAGDIGRQMEKELFDGMKRSVVEVVNFGWTVYDSVSNLTLAGLLGKLGYKLLWKGGKYVILNKAGKELTEAETKALLNKEVREAAKKQLIELGERLRLKGQAAANIFGWGSQQSGALARLNSLTKADVEAMKAAGLIIQDVQEWRLFYELAELVAPGSPVNTPVIRAQLMDKILELW